MMNDKLFICGQQTSFDMFDIRMSPSTEEKDIHGASFLGCPSTSHQF